MEHTNLRRAKYTAVFLALLGALAIITVLNINIGSVPISIGEIARILFQKTGKSLRKAECFCFCAL